MDKFWCMYFMVENVIKMEIKNKSMDQRRLRYFSKHNYTGIMYFTWNSRQRMEIVTDNKAA